MQVGAEPMVVDPGRQTITTSISYDQLQRLPSSRDPWVVLQTVPGVVVDRVNVGGAESGQQSNVLAKGAGVTENTWNLDGIPVTDLAATGSLADLLQLRHVPGDERDHRRRIRDQSHRRRAAEHAVQDADRTSSRARRISMAPAKVCRAPTCPTNCCRLAGDSGKGNRMKELSDVGFDVGGPIVRDRWWAWGSYGRTDGTLYTLNGDPDRTLLENVAFKATGQLTPTIRPEFLFFRGNKVKNGRGASPLRAPETTWDQTGPTPLYKGQVNIIASNNVFLTVRAAATSATASR